MTTKTVSKKKKNNNNNNNNNWCNEVNKARKGLDSSLHISYPCENLSMPSSKSSVVHVVSSAIVCVLTDGLPKGSERSRIVFTSQDYINGALALGASIRKYVFNENSDNTASSTSTSSHSNNINVHQLLLIRDGFYIPDEEKEKLEAVGWTIGTTPTINIERQYVPRFQRYKTTYTKLSVVGLSEYKCVMLLDADTLIVGNIDELLNCHVFDNDNYNNNNANINNNSSYKVAGTLDYYHRRWLHFNTGSLLWSTSNNEMMRIIQLTKDPNFMKRYESDQIFLNNVYPDRTNISNNNIILQSSFENDDDDNNNNKDESLINFKNSHLWGNNVVTLPWYYNTQTHVEVQMKNFYFQHRSKVKIIHYTEKKGWQCNETHVEPTSSSDTYEPFCYDSYRWWNSLRNANDIIINKNNSKKKQ